MKPDGLDWNKTGGLIPAIIQEARNGDVLMLGYMDRTALEKTLASGWVWFYSRTRNRLWLKGETSGNRLRVESVAADCDGDTLLVRVRLSGTAVCHTGTRTCFDSGLQTKRRLL